MIKTPLEYPKDPTLLDPLNQLLKIKIWGLEWKNQVNEQHGDGQMQRLIKKSYIIQTNCKHSKGGYGRLPLGNVYTCHEFLPRMGKFEKANSKTFFYKLIKRFVNKGFSNPWGPPINKIYGT